MDVYHIFARLKPGVRDMAFVDAVHAYLGHLHAEGELAGYRIMRRKLGLGPSALHEWHLMLEFDSMVQIDEAFHVVARRSAEIEALHHAVNSKVADVTFALYRDFPDHGRVRGDERF